MNPDIPEPQEAAPATNAVSLFGQGGGANDFPVLKAFQEYIYAEQAKARKRMFGLSIFFIVLLIVVVVTFTIVITSVIGRNQALSDRLLDIALRERAPATQPVVNVQSPAPAPVVQPVLQHSAESAELARLREELQRQKEERQVEQAKRDKEQIDSLKAQLAKAQQQPVAPTPVVVTTSPTPIVQPAAESAELARLREELRREKEARKAEQDKREKEKKEAEKEAFLRRQYPDYYAKEDARKAAAAETERRATPPLPTPVPNPVQRPAPVPHQPVSAAAPLHAPVVPASPSQPVSATPSKTQNGMKPVSYFDESEPAEDPELKELLKPRVSTQPAQQPVAKSAPPPVVQQAPKPAAKPTPQPAAKPTPKPAQSAATPPAQTTAQPTPKTETLAIGGAADGSSIPWLIELPVQQ